MALTKATQNVITPNIVTTDTRQTITAEKVIECLYDTTSTTSLTIGTGSKTLTVGTGLTWVAGRVAIIRNGSSTSRFMLGSVTSYDPATGVMVVNVTTVGTGTGTYTSWVVSQSSTTALPALRITSGDTNANAFVVEDSTNPDSTPTVITYSGNLIVGAIGIPGGVSSQIKHYVEGGASFTFQNLSKIPSSSAYGFGNFWLEPTMHGVQVGQLDWRLTGNSNQFTSPTDALINYDLISEFNLFTSGQFQNVIADMSKVTLFEVTVIVRTIQVNTTTGITTENRGAYSGNVVIGLFTTGSFGGYTVNSLAGTGTTTVNFTTAAGIAPTISGTPVTGFVSMIATRETISSNGSLTLQVRPHTNANTANLFYQTNVAIHLRALTS